MGRLFFFVFFGLLAVLALLFFPIYLQTNAHYDMNRKKFCFSVNAYKKIKLIGGYATTYPGGVALHVSKKKAFLLPYAQINDKRKRFSFIKTFRLKSFVLTTESGAEYLFLTALTQAVLRVFFFVKGGKKEGVENNFWLTDGDVLRVSLESLVYFNLFILLCAFIKFCKEKLRELWHKKMKN